MITSLALKNFGPISSLHWRDLGRINLIIGQNGSGKTFLLKAIYAAMKTIEMYRRGDDQRSAGEILAGKLRWTFQIDKLSDLVGKGKDELRFDLTVDGKTFRYAFGKETNKQINDIENATESRASNSIFIPAQEIFSLYRVILKSRDEESLFGFDDTYLDLARALQRSAGMSKNGRYFADCRERLKSLLGGKVEYEEKTRRWSFKKGNQKFPIGVTAEGVKKMATVETLLGNGYLDNKAVMFLDEPEAALHPAAVSAFMDILCALSEGGIQIFLAGHSYFVIKKLFLIAQKWNINIPLLSLGDGRGDLYNLLDEMPDNDIIDESIKLYEQEVEIA